MMVLMVALMRSHLLAILLANSFAIATSHIVSGQEFRGVWIATVANIDWPSRPGLPAEAQQRELLAMLDRCRDLNLNVVILQVRPMCDALYESEIEPWSSFLSGRQGVAPGYDPLALAVKEAHTRGLELHAWLNPYRAWVPSAKGSPAANHILKTRPDLVKNYGKHHWLNPTHPDVKAHSLAVVLDVVKRYAIDGIHMDDYFYPYPELDQFKNEIPFPDDDTWNSYRSSGGTLSRDDWRREAVNSFVRDLYVHVHKIRPQIKVGLSPFGIWRPGFPQGIVGFDPYTKLYADAKLWLNEGWVDYLAPQLYWPIDQEKQSYPKLLAWWQKENIRERLIVPGNYTSKFSATEIQNQVQRTRAMKAGGNIHFSMKSLTGEKFATMKELYKQPAKVPPMPWLEKNSP